MSSLMSPSDKKVDGFPVYELESKLDTLVRAEEILEDVKLMAAIAKVAKGRLEASAKVANILETKVATRLKKTFK